MKHTKKHTTHASNNRHLNLTSARLSFVVLFSAIMAWLVYGAFAATAGTVGLIPDKASLTKGSTVSVTINAKTSAKVLSAYVGVFYDSSKLKLTTTDFSTSSFSNSVDVPLEKRDGYIEIARQNLNSSYPTGNNIVIGKLNFESLSTGNATLSIAQPPTTELYDFDTNSTIALTLSGTSINITNPQTPTNPGTTTPPPPTSNPVKPTQTAPTPSTSRPNTTTPSPSRTPTSNQAPTQQNYNPTTNPTENTYYDSYVPPVQQPKTSTYIGTKPSLSVRLLIIFKKLLPILIIGGVVGVSVWFLIGKLHSRQLSGFVGPARPPHSVGNVGSVTPPPPPQGGTTTNYVNKPSVSSGSDNDKTPRTFSGV